MKAFNKVWHGGIIFQLKQTGNSRNLLKLLADFLKDRKQRVVLNWQVSNWADATTGALQESILGPLFLIYINDLAISLSSNAKLFADDTLANWIITWLKLIIGLSIGKWILIQILANRLKKLNKISHHHYFFNNIQVTQFSSQKYLGLLLDEQLTFCEHLKMLRSKINKTIGLLQKFWNLLPISALITIYKAFVRPRLDDGYIIHDEAYNASFHHKLELLQDIVCPAITGAISGISKEKFYQELGLVSLQLQCWFRKHFFFQKNAFSRKFIKIISLVIFPVYYHNQILLWVLEM